MKKFCLLICLLCIAFGLYASDNELISTNDANVIVTNATEVEVFELNQMENSARLLIEESFDADVERVSVFIDEDGVHYAVAYDSSERIKGAVKLSLQSLGREQYCFDCGTGDLTDKYDVYFKGEYLGCVDCSSGSPGG